MQGIQEPVAGLGEIEPADDVPQPQAPGTPKSHLPLRYGRKGQ